jgi:hypothetical protein
MKAKSPTTMDDRTPSPYHRGGVLKQTARRGRGVEVHVVDERDRPRVKESAKFGLVRDLWRKRWHPNEWAERSRKPEMRFLPFALAIVGNVLEHDDSLLSCDYIDTQETVSIRTLTKMVGGTTKAVTHKDWHITVRQMDNFVRNFSFVYGKGHEQHLSEYEATGRVNLRHFCYFTLRFARKLVMEKYAQRKHKSLKHGCFVAKEDFHRFQKPWKPHRVQRALNLLNQ